MKLRNKKTGEIVSLQGELTYDDKVRLLTHYNSLAELNEDWEDYEEPKSGIEGIRLNDMIAGRHIVEIDFTEVKQAEKAVEKLKAWKRLRDKGFKFDRYTEGKIDFSLDEEYSEYTYDGYDEGCEFYVNNEVECDLDLLFGGKE